MQGMPVSLPESFSQNPQGAEIGLWPLAWGWWIVILLSLLVLIGGAYWLVSRYRSQRALRQAISHLKTLPPENRALAQCNQILKRAFMSYFPTGVVASLHGIQWTQFMEQQVSEKNKARFQPLFTALNTGLYQELAEQSTEHQELVSSTIAYLKCALPPGRKQRKQMEANHD